MGVVSKWLDWRKKKARFKGLLLSVGYKGACAGGGEVEVGGGVINWQPEGVCVVLHAASAAAGGGGIEDSEGRGLGWESSWESGPLSITSVMTSRRPLLNTHSSQLISALGVTYKHFPSK